MSAEPATCLLGRVRGLTSWAASRSVRKSDVPGLVGRFASAGSSRLAACPRPFRPVLAAAAFSLLLAAGSAEAQTSVSLVDNTGQSTSDIVGFDAHADYAQGFTTGSHGGAYKLTSVGIDVGLGNPSNTTEPDYSVSIFSAGADGFPDSNLGTLTNPSTLVGESTRSRPRATASTWTPTRRTSSYSRQPASGAENLK